MTNFHFRLLPLLFITSVLVAVTESTGENTKSLRRTTVYSQVSPTFERTKTGDGQWEPQTYALAIGKMLDPSQRDESLTNLSIEEMSEILANALYTENYIPESNPDNTDLMIIVNWGKTVPFNGSLGEVSLVDIADATNKLERINLELKPGGELTLGSNDFEAELETTLTIQAMAERERRKANDFNARLLGFAPSLTEYYMDDPLGGPQRTVFDDLVAEVETSRYFVILQAYDFRKLIENKEKDLLWITRFSMRARGREFDEELANMTRSAASYFGRNSGKLKRGLLPGKVSLGELEVVDEAKDIDDLQ